MNDPIHDFIQVWCPEKHKEYLLNMLDAEREAHRVEVEELQTKLTKIENETIPSVLSKRICEFSERLEKVKATRTKLHAELEASRKEVEDLRRQLANNKEEEPCR